MREAWEKFAQMDLSLWLSVIAVAFCATIVRLMTDDVTYTKREAFSLMFKNSFVAYITALYLLATDVSARMIGAIVGIVGYQATNILSGVAKIGAAFAKDPFSLFDKISKRK